MAFGRINFKADNLVAWFRKVTGDITFSFSPKIKSKVSSIQGVTVSGTTGTVNAVFSNSPTLVTPALGTPASGTLTNCTFPTLNQNTTGSAAALSVSGQTGLITLAGTASTSRIKTVRDAADTILELGGSYTPTGTWTSQTMVTPVLGTPTSGTLTNCTGYTDAHVTFSDVTTGNVSTSNHGFAPKAPNDATKFLDGTGAYSVPTGTSITVSSKSTDYTLVAADKGTIVELTGSTNHTFAFTAAATLASGWFCFLHNNSTAELTVDPNASETIDGLTSYKMYPGEVRLVQCSGTAFTTILEGAGTATFNATSTWQRPPGYSAFSFTLIGSGASGGARATGGNVGGGAGGPMIRAENIPASYFVAVGSTETITVGALVAGVSGATVGTNGNISAITINGVSYATTASTGGATNSGSILASGGTVGSIPTPPSVSITDTSGTGGSCNNSNVPGGGSNAIMGGGGGGSSSSTSGGVRTGGTSTFGGAGGAGGANTGGNGTNGTAPGGGGGGAVQGGTSGSGAAGQVIVRGIM